MIDLHMRTSERKFHDTVGVWISCCKQYRAR